MNYTLPIVLCHGKCKVVAINPVEHSVHIQLFTPNQEAVKMDEDDTLHFIQRHAEVAFNYMLAESFIKDKNYMVHTAIIGT